MDMDDIAAGKDAGSHGLHVLVNDGAVGAAVHGDPCCAGQFIFRNKTDREQDGITVEDLLSARNGTAVFVNTADDNLLDPFFSDDIGNGVAEVERNIIIVEALDNIAVEPVGIGAKLDAGKHLGTLQRHAASHDKTDIAGAENDHPTTDHVALHIDIALRRPRGKDTGGTIAGNGNSAAGTLPAAHCQHDSAGTKLLITLNGIDAADTAVGGDLHHHRIQQHLCLGLLQQPDKASGIFGPGQLLPEAVQTEAIVDTLIEDTAQLAVTLDDKNLFGSFFAGGARRSQTGGSAADDDDIILFH